MSAIIEEFVTVLTPKAAGHIKGTARLDIADEGSVLLTKDGATVSDDDADVVLKASAKTFREILSGDQNPITAVMSGKLKVDGNQMRALKVSEILTS